MRTPRRTARTLALLTLLAGCEAISAVPTDWIAPAESPWTDAAAGVAHPRLAELCTDAWEYGLVSDPVGATRLGDPRYHGRLPDNSQSGADAHARRIAEFVARAERIPAHELNDTDRTTLRLLYDEWQNELAEHELDIDVASWNLDPLNGPQLDFQSLPQDQPIATSRERDALLERWSAMAVYVDRATTNLKRGLARGRVASRTATSETLAQLDTLLGTPPEASPLVAIASAGGAWIDNAAGRTLVEIAASHGARASDLAAANPEAAHAERPEAVRAGRRPPRWIFAPAHDDDLLPRERGRFAHGVHAIVVDEIYPAMRRYRDRIRDDVLPRTRGDDRPGVMHVAGGERYYELCIQRHTSLDRTPRAIHDFGLAEVARIRAEISALGAKVLGTSDVAQIQTRLRTDPALHFASAEEVKATAEASLARAQAIVPAAFGILPRAACIVVPIPEHEAPFTTVAYYREPAADGSRPGRYFVNTFEPKTRPRYEAEVLAFHEAVPGHHLQIAIAQELGALPLVRRHSGSTAYIEGWALYTERLCDELGLYSSDVDRLGILSYDAWRACRLVVDTGIHALGWSRQQAIDYMKENTLLAENNIANEVDRYIAWPGQALAYKLGQREILDLRAQARSALGERFRLSEFHDRVLENGAVTLSELRASVERWIARGGGGVRSGA